jgi:pyroglutamyl-peptidase
VQADNSNILITAFEPFGGDELNSSACVLDAFCQSSADGFGGITTLVLPVEYDVAISRLITAIETGQPHSVVCLGQANGQNTIAVEKVAVNYCSYRIPDNSGAQPADEPVVSDGPTAYFSTLPVDELVNELSKKGIPAEVSLSAGSFACNALFYGLSHYLEKNALSIRAGFIHLPRLPDQVNEQWPESMALETQIDGLGSVVRVLLDPGVL